MRLITFSAVMRLVIKPLAIMRLIIKMMRLITAASDLLSQPAVEIAVQLDDRVREICTLEFSILGNSTSRRV